MSIVEVHRTEGFIMSNERFDIISVNRNIGVVSGCHGSFPDFCIIRDLMNDVYRHFCYSISEFLTVCVSLMTWKPTSFCFRLDDQGIIGKDP